MKQFDESALRLSEPVKIYAAPFTLKINKWEQVVESLYKEKVPWKAWNESCIAEILILTKQTA